MNILVTYYSETGNTKKVAEAIFEALEGEKHILSMHEVESLDGYDLTFIGFPLMQFGPARKVRIFLKSKTINRKVALFVTHASWESPGQTEILAGWLERCKEAAAEAQIAGFFHCRGELSENAALRFLQSDIEEVRHFGSLQPATSGHPDESELAGARTFAKNILKPVS